MSRNNGDSDIRESIRFLENTIKIKQERLKESAAQSSILMSVLNQAPQVYLSAKSVLEYGKAKFKPTLTKWRKEVQDEPWALLGKVALYSFCTGFLLSTILKTKEAE